MINNIVVKYVPQKVKFSEYSDDITYVVLLCK